MNMPVGFATPDYRAMPLEDLDVSDPRMFQYDYWHELFARLREECPIHYQPDSPAGPFWSVTRYEDIVAIEGSEEKVSVSRSIATMSS